MSSNANATVVIAQRGSYGFAYREPVGPETLAKMFDVTTATIRLWEQQGRIPRAIRINARVVRWNLGDVLEQMEAKGASVPTEEKIGSS